MTKARLIKRHEIKERDAQQEPVTEEKRYTKEGVPVDWTKRKKGQDPRKAFADLFIQPQTQTR
jgi:hypothetical protein